VKEIAEDGRWVLLPWESGGEYCGIDGEYSCTPHRSDHA